MYLQVIHLFHVHVSKEGIKNYPFFAEKFTIACFCEIGGLKKSKQHWHCPECQRVVTCAENFKSHIASHGLCTPFYSFVVFHAMEMFPYFHTSSISQVLKSLA